MSNLKKFACKHFYSHPVNQWVFKIVPSSHPYNSVHKPRLNRLISHGNRTTPCIVNSLRAEPKNYPHLINRMTLPKGTDRHSAAFAPFVAMMHCNVLDWRNFASYRPKI